MREANEEQQQALFNLMLLVDSGHFSCTNCGHSGDAPDLEIPESSCTIGHWLSSKSLQLQEGQRGHAPDCNAPYFPTEEYAIVAPSRIASRDIQQAGMDLIRVARSEKACPCCGETMRMHHDSDEMFAVVVINEWLGRQYPRAA
jgi:hypothetical protein